MPNIRSAANFNGNQIQNVTFQILSGAPSTPYTAQFWWNSGNGCPYYFNGSNTRPLDAAFLTDGSIQLSALAVNPTQRSNHTGTQTASTISDLATTVKGYSLDSFAAAAANVSFGNFKITNLAAGTNPTDAVNLTQVTSLIASAIAGQTAIKNPARVVTTSNITLSGLQTVDGITLNAGDRALVNAQTTASQNNVYNVQTGAWVIATDANSSGEWVEGTEILITEGVIYGGSIFRQTTQNPTVTTLTFVQTAKINQYTADGSTLLLNGSQFSVKVGSGLVANASGLAVDTTIVARKYTSSISGDGTTTTFVITHNLNTRNIVPAFMDASYNSFLVDWAATTVNTMTVTFGIAPGPGVTSLVTVVG